MYLKREFHELTILNLTVKPRRSHEVALSLPQHQTLGIIVCRKLSDYQCHRGVLYFTAECQCMNKKILALIVTVFGNLYSAVYVSLNDVIEKRKFIR